MPESVHTGRYGIDNNYGVISWERDFISQMELLEWTEASLAVDIFENRLLEIAARG